MDSICQSLESSRVVVIIRKLDMQYLIPVVEAVKRGGVKFVEVTFDPANVFPRSTTLHQIEALREHFGASINVGAGTVLTNDDVKDAKSAGASFIISPNTDAAVIAETKKQGMLSIPGAMTPTEIQAAHLAGCDYVKIFPATEMGPEYFRAVLAPLSHIKVLAVGGIDERNAHSYIAAGAVGVGVGSCIIRRDAIKEDAYGDITLYAKKMLSVVQ